MLVGIFLLNKCVFFHFPLSRFFFFLIEGKEAVWVCFPDGPQIPPEFSLNPLTSGRVHLDQDVLPFPAQPRRQRPQHIPHRGVHGQHRHQARVVGPEDLVGHCQVTKAASVSPCRRGQSPQRGQYLCPGLSGHSRCPGWPPRGSRATSPSSEPGKGGTEGRGRPQAAPRPVEGPQRADGTCPVTPQGVPTLGWGDTLPSPFSSLREGKGEDGDRTGDRSLPGFRPPPSPTRLCVTPSPRPGPPTPGTKWRQKLLPRKAQCPGVASRDT